MGKKAKGTDKVQEWGLGIESEAGILLTEQREATNRWKDYIRCFLESEVRVQT